MKKQILIFFSAVLLLISGCAPRAGSSRTATDDETYVNFPSLIVEYDRSGGSTIFKQPISELNKSFPTVDLSLLSFEAETISLLIEHGVKTIHIDNQPGGIRFFVNGESYPSLIWDETTRTGLVNALGDLGVETGPFAGLIEVMSELGIGVTLKMPNADDDLFVDYVTPILDKDEADAILAKARAVTYQAIALTYDEDGQPSGQLPPLFGDITLDTLALSTGAIANIQQQGIEQLHVVLTGSGLIVFINEHELPHVALEREEVARLLRLYGDLDGCLEICPIEMLLLYLELYLEHFPVPLGLEFEFPKAK